MTIESPLWLDPNPTTGDAPTYSARQDRGIIGALFTEGVENVQGGDLLVTQHTAGVAMSVDVAVGVGYVKGDDIPRQGTYRAVVSATETVAIPAAPATGSRIDLIVLAIHDITAAGGGRHGASIDIISGTAATSPAVPVVPASALALAQVMVAAGTSAITNAMITDRRTAVGAGAAMGIAAQPLTTAQRDAIASPTIGQLIYNTNNARAEVYGSTGWRGVASAQVDVFTASGTWTKPAGATLVEVTCIGGAGGGGSYASTGGAYGGAGGGYSHVTLPAAALPASVSVVVGAGGSGGLYSSSIQATSGGTTTFGSWVGATGGTAGAPISGTATLNVPGGTALNVPGGNPASLDTSPTRGGYPSYGAPYGGGGGGNTSSAGGASGALSGPAAGTAASPSGTAGNSRSGSGLGGSGGSGTYAGAANTGVGGAGGIPGGGGGGAWGQAGAGARGEVVVITFF